MPIEHGDNSDDEKAELTLKRETDKARKTRIKRAYDIVMALPEGRAVIWDIVARGGLLNDPAVFGDHDRTWHALGRQQFAREIYLEIGKEYPARLVEMEQENMR